MFRHLLIPIYFSLVTFLGAQSSFPEKPIKIIVPFSAGGGSDTFVRLIQKAIEEENLLSHPVVVINVPGAGGTIGSRKLKEEEPDGYTIMCLHEAILTAKHSGKAEYGYEAFEPIAATGEIGILVAVYEDSPYESLGELMDAAAERPYEVSFSTNLGAPSDYVVLMLEQAKSGAKFRPVQNGGGAKRFHAIKGGHSDVTVFSLSEYNQFKSSGLRALGLCAKERHPNWPDIPTANEQGFDVERENTHFWWAPKGTPQDRIQVIQEALAKAMKSPLVLERLKEMHTDPTFLSGDALMQTLAEREKKIAGVPKRAKIPLPNFPILSLVVVVLLSVVVFLQSRMPKATKTVPSEKVSYTKNPLMAVLAVGFTAIYVFVMQIGWIGFTPATLVYICAIGMLLSKWDKKQLPMTAIVAVIMAFGLYYSFTEIFVIDLPK